MGPPGSRAWRFRACTGSQTARGPPTARASAADDVAFRLVGRRRHPEAAISRLNGRPTRTPVNASPAPSRTPTHDSGPPWIATPSMQGSLIPFSMPVYPGAPHVPCKSPYQARAAFMPGTTWPASRHPPGSSRGNNWTPVSECHRYAYDVSTVVHSRSPSRLTPDTSRAPFPQRSPPRLIHRRSLRWFETSPCVGGPGGPTSITSAAPHPKHSVYIGTPFSVLGTQSSAYRMSR
jgi:hypothetical protein